MKHLNRQIFICGSYLHMECMDYCLVDFMETFQHHKQIGYEHRLYNKKVRALYEVWFHHINFGIVCISFICFEKKIESILKKRRKKYRLSVRSVYRSKTCQNRIYEISKRVETITEHTIIASFS